jgi:hypothetical protein
MDKINGTCRGIPAREYTVNILLDRYHSIDFICHDASYISEVTNLIRGVALMNPLDPQCLNHDEDHI